MKSMSPTVNTDGGIGSDVHMKVVAVILGTGDQSEEDFSILGFRDGEEGSDWWSNRVGGGVDPMLCTVKGP